MAAGNPSSVRTTENILTLRTLPSLSCRSAKENAVVHQLYELVFFMVNLSSNQYSFILSHSHLFLFSPSLSSASLPSKCSSAGEYPGIAPYPLGHHLQIYGGMSLSSRTFSNFCFSHSRSEIVNIASYDPQLA